MFCFQLRSECKEINIYSGIYTRISRDIPRFDPWVRKIPWRREWHPTPVLLPGESHGESSLVGFSPWGHSESDRAKRLTLYPCVTWEGFLHLAWGRESATAAPLSCVLHVGALHTPARHEGEARTFRPCSAQALPPDKKAVDYSSKPSRDRPEQSKSLRTKAGGGVRGR